MTETAVRRDRPTTWQRRSAQAVAAWDLVVLSVAALAGVLGAFGADASYRVGGVSLAIAVITFVVAASALKAFRCWDSRVIGHGSEEFNRAIRAFVSSIVVLGLLGLIFKVHTVRPWVFIVLPAAGAAAMAGRYVVRLHLHRGRRTGRFLLPVLAVGTPGTISELIRRTRRAPESGWVISAACTPCGRGRADAPDVDGVPVTGDLDAIVKHVADGGYRVVAVSPAPGWTPHRLRQLCWGLEGSGAEVMVDAGLMEVAGPRLSVTPVDHLPLLRLTEPRFTGVPRVMKAVLDRLCATILITLLLPLFLVVAVAIRRDGGPALSRLRRVGLGGHVFMMLTFRTVSADTYPAPTKIGSRLIRSSLAALPQLFNVLSGRMSFIGPRPPLPDEVHGYERDARRKLLVKPGMTGLWLIDGDPELSWEESVRLDLRYVENWSPAMDLSILARTIGVMVRGSRAA